MVFEHLFEGGDQDSSSVSSSRTRQTFSRGSDFVGISIFGFLEDSWRITGSDWSNGSHVPGLGILSGFGFWVDYCSDYGFFLDSDFGWIIVLSLCWIG